MQQKLALLPAFVLVLALALGAPAEIVLTPENAEVLVHRNPFGTTLVAVEEMTNALTRAFGTAWVDGIRIAEIK